MDITNKLAPGTPKYAAAQQRLDKISKLEHKLERVDTKPFVPLTYQRLDDIEDVEDFYTAIDRKQLTRKLSPERPYTYWTIELYDQENGIRGGGGLGILSADIYRTAERMNVPLTLITPFYPSEAHQVYRDGKSTDTHHPVDWHDFGFNFIDKVSIRCPEGRTELDVIEKTFGSTRLLCVTEPNFGELYSGESGSDHRLYQEVSLGFGGYQALKLVGLKPAIMQLNEVATFFAALARLDELAANGMDFYEAVVYTRKHTLYTNHTLVQAAEASFAYDQFERYVFPNLKSLSVKKWLSDKFRDGRIRLSDPTIEIAELRSGVSKLHARVANYHDIAGEKVKFKAVTNGIDMPRWVLPDIMKFYQDQEILDKFYLPTENYNVNLRFLTYDQILVLKKQGRTKMQEMLAERVNQYGEHPVIPDDALIFDFKRRFVDYKRPTLPFTDPARLRNILERFDAYYILAGRVHSGDAQMAGKLHNLLQLVDSDPVLRQRVHYLPDYDEATAQALTFGSNVAINTPIVGLEACGTSWEKDIANLNLLISTHDGGVADAPNDNYLNVSGTSETEEAESLYARMEEAANTWRSRPSLEYWIQKQLTAYLPTISGTRMLKDYLSYLFPE